MSIQDWDAFVEFGRQAVKMVEQLSITGVLENAAAEKKDEALRLLSDQAAKLGLNVTEDELNVVIESAIRDGVHKGWEEWAAPIKTAADSTPVPADDQTSK